MTNKHKQLLKAVVEHSGLEAEAIAEAGVVGADAGWSGFVYNHEAATFFDEHHELIWDLLCEDAEDMGSGNPVQADLNVRPYRHGRHLHRLQGLALVVRAGNGRPCAPVSGLSVHAPERRFT